MQMIMIIRCKRKYDMTKNEIFLDADFQSGCGNCKYHCSPSCHPAKVGPDWKYGCTHQAWPSNKYGDFVPIVDCGGDTSKCELKDTKIAGYYLRGKKQSFNYTAAKLSRLDDEINEFKILIGLITKP